MTYCWGIEVGVESEHLPVAGWGLATSATSVLCGLGLLQHILEVIYQGLCDIRTYTTSQLLSPTWSTDSNNNYNVKLATHLVCNLLHA